MCLFCDKDNNEYGELLSSSYLPIGNSGFSAIMLVEHNRFLRTKIYDKDSEIVWQFGNQIQFCPMCGRKLE